MIINFERDMLWPETPVRFATWGATETSISPPVSQDGVVSSHTAYVRGPVANPTLTAPEAQAYGLSMLPPGAERAVYRVIADGSGEGFVGYAFADVSGGAGDIALADSDVVFVGGLNVDAAVCIPPHPSDPDLSLLFFLMTRDADLAESFLSVQRLVARPPSYACSVS